MRGGEKEEEGGGGVVDGPGGPVGAACMSPHISPQLPECTVTLRLETTSHIRDGVKLQSAPH